MARSQIRIGQAVEHGIKVKNHGCIGRLPVDVALYFSLLAVLLSIVGIRRLPTGAVVGLIHGQEVVCSRWLQTYVTW